MLQTKWIVFLTMAFILGSLLSGVIEGAYLGENGGASVLTPFISVAGISGWDTFSNVISLPFQASTYSSLWHMFMWDYAFFTGPYAIVQLILRCISAGLAISVILTMFGLVRGTSI